MSDLKQKTTNSAEITVAYNDGTLLVVDHVCLVDTFDRGKRESINKNIVDLRFVLPPDLSEEFLMALRTGQIIIEVVGAQTLMERCM